MSVLSSSMQIYANNASGIGTVGGFFSFSDGVVYGITNNHVIANANECSKGDPIYQYGAGHLIGTLQYWVILDANDINYLDIALFEVAEGVDISWSLPDGVDMPKKFDRALLNDRVYFILPNGDLRTGSVSIPCITTKQPFTLCGTDFDFTGLIEVISDDSAPFSDHGNSGSLVYNSNHDIIGVVLGNNYDLSRSYVVPFLNGNKGITSVYDFIIAGGAPVSQNA